MEESLSLNGILEIRSDGSIYRMEFPESMFEGAYPNGKDGVASKDVTINQELGLWGRIYLPTSPMNSTNSATDNGQSVKVPVVVFFHGGGFCIFTPASCEYDTLCREVAKKASVMVVSVNYRLAPEFRLPAAYEDAATTLQWISTHTIGSQEDKEEEQWLSEHGDMNKVFLMGDSAGGNIVHHVVAQAAKGADTWHPMMIRGLIMLQPFFGGEERSETEKLFGQKGKKFLPLETSDSMWCLALPQGCNRDHPFCNLWANGEDVVNVFGEKCFPSALVMLGGKDILKDRGLRYAEDLRRSGKDVEVVVYEKENHAFYAFKQDSSNFSDLLGRISKFVSSQCPPSKQFNPLHLSNM